MKLTTIIPCYNEAPVLQIFYEELDRVTKLMPEVEFQILFVNDGSKDNTLDEIKRLDALDSRVNYVSFSRNFGKEAAMFAGLEYAEGDYAVFMDADLQDPPALLPEMWKAVTEEGYDSVATRRVTRKGEPPIRSFFARMFYRIMNSFTEIEVVDGARDFRMMSRAYIDALLEMGETNRFSKGLFGWVGFKTKWLEYENIERAAGETKWSFWKLTVYAIDGIVAFSTKPLIFSAIFGLLMCLASIIAIIFVIIRQLLYGGSAYGWPSMVCIIMLIGGIQLFSIGILGIYLSKTYLEVKKRPIYICGETDMKE